MEATLSSKSQATIPKAVRDHLRLKPGDRFKFFLQPDGGVSILPVLSVTNLKGSLAKRERPVSVEEMNAGVEAGAARRSRR